MVDVFDGPKLFGVELFDAAGRHVGERQRECWESLPLRVRVVIDRHDGVAYVTRTVFGETKLRPARRQLDAIRQHLGLEGWRLAPRRPGSGMAVLRRDD